MRTCLLTTLIALMTPAGLTAKPAATVKDSPSNEQKTGELLELLGGGKKDGSNWRLNRHWVGTLKPVVASKFYKENKDSAKDEPVRFNVFDSFLKFGGHKEGFPALIAMGRHGFSQYAMHRSELPSTMDLQDKDKIAAILASFGDQHGWTDGWGSKDQMHWTEGWRWFTPLDGNRIRVLTVFAHVSRKAGEPKQIDELIVREGIFRPSGPSDAKAAKNFPSEDENETKRHGEIDAEDNMHPEPLRSYVRADHAPGDSNLKIWFAAVRKFRDNPEGTLLKQITARLDDGTCEMSSMLETLFRHMTFEKEIGGWNSKKQAQARALLLDALPEANSRESLGTAVELALRETGIGSIKIDTAELLVELSSHYNRSGGMACTLTAFELKSCSVRRAGEILRDDILRRWQKKK